MFLFKNIFRKKKLKSPVDLSVVEVDMHSHVLPGIDDGAEDISTAVRMVNRLAGLGFRKLITSPHIMADIYNNTPNTVLKAKNELKQRLKEENVSTEITAIAEYMLDEGLVAHSEKFDMLTFGNNHILVELPYYNEPPNINESIFQLQLKGYKVVLAHPERYVYWYNDLSKFESLRARDVLFQLNILTFANAYSFPSREIANYLIKREMIDFIGSDLHDERQYKLIEEALYEPSLARLIESGNIKNKML